MADQKTLNVVILAAGKGTRMKSVKAKVLHEAFYAPMLHHVLDSVTPLHPSQTVVIIGHQGENVTECLSNYTIDTAPQDRQLGTGHAVLCAEPVIERMEGCTMILCGDTPLIRPETLQSMIEQHNRQKAMLTIMTTILDNPTHYGRIISDDSGKVLAIVEEKDCSDAERRIKEINAGIYCIDSRFLFRNLKKIGTDNSQGEVYLTDIVTLAVKENLSVHKFVNDDPVEVLGVNSRQELAQAHHELQLRRNRNLMAAGVSIINPDTVQIGPDVTVAQDVTIHQGVEICGTSTIGPGTIIRAGAVLKDIKTGSNCNIGPYCCLQECTIPDNSIIPPHSTAC